MTFVHRVALAILLLLTAALDASAQTAPAPTVSAQTASTRVTFLLVNDIYSMSEQVLPDGRARGGFARLAAVVKSERARGGHVFFAHAGDTLSPSLMSGLDQGAHIVTLTNMIRPDVFVPGNHEFDFGKAVFVKRMGELQSPIYASNLLDPGGGRFANIHDRRILVFDGVRIGVTGAAYDQTPRTSSPEDLLFQGTVDAIAAQGQALRGEGADFVLGVMHGERAQANELHRRQAVDLLLTGHTHDLFLAFDGRSAVAESSYDAHYVVAIDVTITVSEQEGRRHAVWWPQFRVIDTATVTPDADVAAVVAGFEAELTREMDVPLATTAVALDSRPAMVRSREAAIGNLIADAMRLGTGADVALMNGGGIRAGKLYPPGSTITRRDVLAELPFGNRVVLVEITGADLRRVVENGLSQLPQSGGRFPQVAGMTVEADLRRPPGERIVSMRIGDAQLVPDKVYRLATNDFLARGSDGYAQLRTARRLIPDHDAKLLANEVMVYLRRLGNVTAGPEGRIVLR